MIRLTLDIESIDAIVRAAPDFSEGRVRDARVLRDKTGKPGRRLPVRLDTGRFTVVIGVCVGLSEDREQVRVDLDLIEAGASGDSAGSRLARRLIGETGDWLLKALTGGAAVSEWVVNALLRSTRGQGRWWRLDPARPNTIWVRLRHLPGKAGELAERFDIHRVELPAAGTEGSLYAEIEPRPMPTLPPPRKV